jgi:hypothetical protein
MTEWQGIMRTVIGIGLGVILGQVLIELTKAGWRWLTVWRTERKFRKLFSASQERKRGNGKGSVLGLEELTRADRFEAVVEDIPLGMREGKRW